MELGVRDWMIIVGILLIVAVLLDGYRRVRNERRGNIRVALNKQFLNAGSDDDSASNELPNGGARVIGRSKSDQDNIDLGLDQAVPMLLDSVPDEISTDHSASRVDVNSTVKQSASITAKSATEKTASAANPSPEEVIVINVQGRATHFNGPDLVHILLACDMRFGEMNIFHRFEQVNGSGEVQFSVVNSVEPGTFDLDSIAGFTTPGVCFFMSVPGPKDLMQAFDCMVETAQCLSKNLDGELLDESRSVMTAQTLEHCRQRLRDFSRRQLTQSA